MTMLQAGKASLSANAPACVAVWGWVELAGYVPRRAPPPLACGIAADPCDWKGRRMGGSSEYQTFWRQKKNEEKHKRIVTKKQVWTPIAFNPLLLEKREKEEPNRVQKHQQTGIMLLLCKCDYFMHFFPMQKVKFQGNNFISNVTFKLWLVLTRFWIRSHSLVSFVLCDEGAACDHESSTISRRFASAGHEVYRFTVMLL